MDRFAQSVQLIARVEVASESDGVEFRNSAFSWDPGARIKGHHGAHPSPAAAPPAVAIKKTMLQPATTSTLHHRLLSRELPP
jgi:hypothetical protein